MDEKINHDDLEITEEWVSGESFDYAEYGI